MHLLPGNREAEGLLRNKGVEPNERGAPDRRARGRGDRGRGEGPCGRGDRRRRSTAPPPSWRRRRPVIRGRWRRLPLRNPGLRLLLLLPRLLGGGGGGGGSGGPGLSATSTSACLPAGGVGGEGDGSSRRPPLPHKKVSARPGGGGGPAFSPATPRPRGGPARAEGAKWPTRRPESSRSPRPPPGEGAGVPSGVWRGRGASPAEDAEVGVREAAGERPVGPSVRAEGAPRRQPEVEGTDRRIEA